MEAVENQETVKPGLCLVSVSWLWVRGDSRPPRAGGKCACTPGTWEPRGDAPDRSTHSNPEHFTAEQQQLFSEPEHVTFFRSLGFD